MDVKTGSAGVYRHFFNWFLWKVVAPFALLVLIWFAYLFKGDIPDPFSAAFAHGELLVFAAILLIEISLEGEELRSIPTRRFNLWFDATLPALRFVALLTIGVFGFIRYDVVSAPINGHTNIQAKLTAYGLLSLTTGAAAVAIALYSCVKHCEYELQDQLSSLSD